MSFIKSNVKKLLVMVIAILAGFGLIGCGETKELQAAEAVGSITLGDVSGLVNSFELNKTTIKHGLEITWELENTDGTLKLETIDEKLMVIVTPTKYTEDSEGNQTNEWGEGLLKATVTIGKVKETREWKLYVKPGINITYVDVKGAKEIEDSKGVEFTGIVSFINGTSGFYVTDATGSIYVYTTPTDDVKLGNEVKVTGNKITYNTQPEIDKGAKIALVKAASTATYDYSKATVATIDDVIKVDKKDLNHYGKFFKVTGLVTKGYANEAGAISDYAIKDVINNKTLAIYNSSTKALKDALEAKVGKYVSVTVLIHDFHSTQLVWRAFGIEGTVEDATEPVLTDQQKVDGAKDQIDELFKGKSFSADINLIAESQLGATITWTSGNAAVVGNDGKVTTPLTDTDVELTAKIVSGEIEVEHKVTIKVLALQEQTIKQVIDALDKADVEYIKTKGVIIGVDADGYYYLADETGVLYVRHKLSADGLKVGDYVQVIGKGTVYLNSNKQYTRQVSGNYTVTKLDDITHAYPQTIVDAQISDFDFTILGDALRTKVPQEDLYGKILKFDLYVTVQGSYSNVYLAASLEENAPKILVYYKSAGYDVLKGLEGKKVKVTAVVYDYSVSDGWRLGFLNNEGDLEFELSEQDKLNALKTDVEKVVANEKEVSGDLNFFTNSINTLVPDAKFVWTTDNLETITAAGKFKAPTTDSNVKVTVKVYLDGNVEGTASATWEYTVVAKAPKTVVTNGIIISQVYGGGGNTGATYKNDFIELYNTTDKDIDVTGWVIFYASETGVFKAMGSQSYTTAYQLSGTVKAKSFFLIQAAAGTTGTADLPTPDAITDLGLGGSAFKVALCSKNELPTSATDAHVVDFVGAGSNPNLYEGTSGAPAPSNTKAVVRPNLTDTNNNGNDFVVADPNPRNSSYKG